eukprot:CAMPEP_0201598810 /NCGR_PEP_ID=MMETSP0492-20130828/504_1 /ASSEMBLY_ACC=CAM_ASM_000837 /TAXON_ID=420259 /ORGANISM="Thalassiosira gravida, Strain GMp14c1" /LENGTH=164 /DNA_ID=CAMNT_0048061289 /DNA_START=51 /DNA_END=545 /DNA_ORIENTATION=-
MNYFLIVIATMAACTKAVDGRVITFDKLKDTIQHFDAADAAEDEKHVDLNESLDQISLPPFQIPPKRCHQLSEFTDIVAQLNLDYYNAFNSCMLKHSATRTCSFDCDYYDTCKDKMTTVLLSLNTALMQQLREFHDCLFEDCQDRNGHCMKSNVDFLDVKRLRA